MACGCSYHPGFSKMHKENLLLVCVKEQEVSALCKALK